MSSRNEIEDPNLSDLPPEAFDEIGPEGPTMSQLEARIRIKREAAMQDSGEMQSPHHADDIEPIEPPDTETDTEADEQQDELEETPAQEREEPDSEEDTDPDAEADESDFYLGRYRSKEEAEKGLAEKDRLIAQMFRERHEREQQRAEQPVEGQAELDTDAWNEWAAEAVDSGQGIQGALAALERGGPQGYDIYVGQWMRSEDPDERAAAIEFNNEVQRQFAQQITQQAQQPVQQPVDQPGVDPATSEALAARDLVATRYPDFADYEQVMEDLVANPASPIDEQTKAWLAQTAREGGIDGKARVWNYLYGVARATAAPRERATQEERKRRRVSGDDAKLQATVSSAEGAQVRTPRSAAELEVLRRRNGIREKAGLPLLSED